MTSNNADHTALGFLTVLDLSENIAGQYCCRMLADYGADVTLVEPPAGSATRKMGPFREEKGREKESILFHHLNTGKHSVALDQSTAEGQKILWDLASTADVLVVPAGFDRAAYRKVNPHCIINTVSPFGDDGPMKHWQGTEMIYQAMSGMMIQNGRRDREPLYGVGQRAYYCAGIAAYTACLAALMVRERTGVAQDIAVDIAHATASMTYPFALQYAYNGSFERRGSLGQPLVEVKTSDGWIAIWIKATDFAATCEGLGLPHLISHPLFVTNADRKKNFQAFIAEVQKHVADLKGNDVVTALQSRRVAAACCFQPTQLGPHAEHLKARDFWSTVQTSDGPRLVLGAQFRMSRTPRRAPAPAPSLGEVRNAKTRGATDA